MDMNQGLPGLSRSNFEAEVDVAEVEEVMVVLTEEMMFNKKCRGDKGFGSIRKLTPHQLQVFRSKILLVKPLLIGNILHQYATCDDYIKDHGYNIVEKTKDEQDFAIAYDHVIFFIRIHLQKFIEQIDSSHTSSINNNTYKVDGSS